MERLAKTITALAKAVGKAQPTVSKWVRHRRWDQGRQPPWDIDKAIAWSKTLRPDYNVTPIPDHAPGESPDGVQTRPMSEAKLKLIRARANKLELERMLLAGELVERADVERGFVQRVHTIRAAFESLPRQLSAALVGQPENEIERLLEQAIAGVLLGISQRPALAESDDE